MESELPPPNQDGKTVPIPLTRTHLLGNKKLKLQKCSHETVAVHTIFIKPS